MPTFAVGARDFGNPFSTKVVNTGGLSGQEPEYIAEAYPGTLTSDSKWRIKKFLYDAGTNNMAGQRWASGTDAFDKIADNYALYTYS